MVTEEPWNTLDETTIASIQAEIVKTQAETIKILVEALDPLTLGFGKQIVKAVVKRDLTLIFNQSNQKGTTEA